MLAMVGAALVKAYKLYPVAYICSLLLIIGSNIPMTIASTASRFGVCFVSKLNEKIRVT